MQPFASAAFRHLPMLLVFCCALVFGFAVKAQNPTQSRSPEDVVRTNIELVQTDVMVFDRRGNFVDSLRPEQFILTLNGQPRDISLFSRVTAGTELEAKQLPAASSSATKVAKTEKPSSTPSRTGRSIFFFFDDVHLSTEGLERGRKALLHFIDQQMEPEDQVAVICTSGRIGFLQQLTDNPAVLHEAVSRLSDRRTRDIYIGKKRISEYVVNQVQEAHDSRLFAYLMESVKVEYGMGGGARRGAHNNDSAGQAYRLLKNRIGAMAAQSRADTAATLDVLQNLIESSAKLPGRKLVFFLSDGFLVDPRTSNALDVLRKITQSAAEAGAVIYSMDARGTGTFGDSGIDAAGGGHVDLTSRQAGRSLGETIVPREPLKVMAEETGGRAIFNSNSFEDAINQAVRETSHYYVLSWRPDLDTERSGKVRIEVSIEGHPDFRVRLRRNYFRAVTTAPVIAAKQESPTAAAPEAQLLSALGASYPNRSLPTSLSVGYVKTTDTAFTLQASMQISRDALDLDQKTEVDVIGAAIDDQGLVYSFKQVLTVVPAGANQTPEPHVIWNQQLSVRPGLYQVRIAVRERQSGRTGSAMEWIEVPGLDQARFGMSSLFLGERGGVSAAQKPQGPQPIRIDVDRHFARSSILRFQTYVYNASRAAGLPDVWIQAQVLRGRQQVAALAPNRIPPDVSKDPTRLPYWTEISLEQLPAGRYTLQVSATDRAANTNASQSISFSVD